MAKTVHNDVLDAMLNEIATANLMTACSAEPTTRTEAVTTYALADIAMTGGDFSNADGDVSGRKVTVGAKAGVLIDASGTANHVALVDATVLLYVTTAPGVVLTSGQNVDFAAWDIEVADPT